jgi:ABC-2 type transport system permease protein
MAMLFAASIFAILAMLAMTIGGVALPIAAWLRLFIVEIFGVLPFCAIGLCIATLVSGQAAPAVVNLIYLPMSFLSGLWMPLSVLPPVVRGLAPRWPAYHLGQLALAAVGQPSQGAAPTHIAALAAVTIVFLAVARRRLARA